MSDSGEDEYVSMYEYGHWEWDEYEEALKFKSDIDTPTGTGMQPSSVIIGAVEFKDDLDLYEQAKFRKKFHRKTTSDSDNIVTLQDIKDLVLYTAPKIILSPDIINILHLSSTERFIRALIFYSQYFIQISESMSKRTQELQKKIPTERSIEIETEFRENLNDLRIIIAKEYAVMVQGTGEFVKYHHKGPNKKMKSLSKKDRIIFESLLIIFIQIVWIALGRIAYSQLEVEINRLFKSDIFNLIEHSKLKINSKSHLTRREQDVLYGNCVKLNGKLKTHSPLMNEYHCERDSDFELFGIGTIKYPRLSCRNKYLERALIMSEEEFQDHGVTLGILGMQRPRFDTTLRELKLTTVKSNNSIHKSSPSRMSTKSVSVKSKKNLSSTRLIEELRIPEREEMESLPEEFPAECYTINNELNEQHRRKWMNYIARFSRNFNSHANKRKIIKTIK